MLILYQPEDLEAILAEDFHSNSIKDTIDFMIHIYRANKSLGFGRSEFVFDMMRSLYPGVSEETLLATMRRIGWPARRQIPLPD